MNKFVAVGEAFGRLVALGDFEAAHAVLTTPAQAEHSPRSLRLSFERMTAYAPGPIREVEALAEFILTEWPTKRKDDVAFVYVGLLGDAYVEAVTVILAEENGTLKIRHLEWGRP